MASQSESLLESESDIVALIGSWKVSVVSGSEVLVNATSHSSSIAVCPLASCGVTLISALSNDCHHTHIMQALNFSY